MSGSAVRWTRRFSTLTLAILMAGCGADRAREQAEKARVAEAQAQLLVAENAKRKAESEAEANKQPKFESELQIVHATAGGTATSSHAATWYTDGKPFTAVENYSTTFRGDKATVKVRVKFLKHEKGEDVFEVESTVEKPGGSESKTTTATYKGEPKTLLDDGFTKVIVQPPSK
jgi:hypothetical protein